MGSTTGPRRGGREQHPGREDVHGLDKVEGRVTGVVGGSIDGEEGRCRKGTGLRVWGPRDCPRGGPLREGRKKEESPCQGSYRVYEPAGWFPETGGTGWLSEAGGTGRLSETGGTGRSSETGGTPGPPLEEGGARPGPPPHTRPLLCPVTLGVDGGRGVSNKGEDSRRTPRGFGVSFWDHGRRRRRPRP